MQRAASGAAKRLRAMAMQAVNGEALRASIDALPIPAAVLDAERTTIAWNPAAESTYGWTAAEVLGARLPLVGDAAEADLRFMLQSALSGQTPVRLEFEGRRRTGELAFVRASASALLAGPAPVVLLVLEDVTDRRMLQRRLLRAQRHGRSVAELSPEPTMILRAGVIAYANAACSRLLGIPRGQLAGREFAGLMDEDAVAFAQLAARRVTRAAGAMLDARLRRPNGDVLDVEVAVTPVLVRRRPSLRLVLRDISQLRRVEAELQRTQDRFRLLSESLRDHAVVALDTEGRILSWNAGAERLFGHAAQAAVGADQSLLFRDEDARAGRPGAELRTALELGRFEAEEWRHRADGTDFWAVVTLTPQYAAENRVIGFAATIRDLSERRQAEETLRRTEEQLRQAQRMEAVGRLAAGVAHDFNNLLTAIRGYAQLLLDDLGSDPRAADVLEIRRAADRGTTLTRQLLAVGRRQVVQPGALDLNAVVREAEKMLRRIVGEDVRLRTRLEPRLGAVTGDATEMEQVLLNLVVNARDALPDGGRITIRTRNVAPCADAYRGRVVLEVTDTGIGMDDETQRRIFEPFFTTKPPGKGTGLGLSTVYGIVQQSDGTIQVRSTPGKGTTFEVSWPRVDEPGTSAGAHPETLLVVVQDRLSRGLAVRTLEHRGYTVLEAASAGEAIRAGRRCAGRVDLLVADPAMTGPGRRALVESLAGVCDVRAVLYLADAGDASAPQLAGGRNASVMARPFTPLALARRVRLLLDRDVAT